MALDPDEQRVLDDIAEYGWHDVCVEEDEEGPGFNYTIGLLERFDHPEVIVFGLDMHLMHDILWGVYRGVESGRRFEEPVLYTGLLEGFACATRPVHESNHPDYLGYAMRYMRHPGKIGQLRAVQLIWPSAVDGSFPWEDGDNDEVSRRQPLLYEPNAADGD